MKPCPDFDQLVALLTQFAPCWSQEVLDHYPDSFQHFPESWRETVAALSWEELAAFLSEQSAALMSEASDRDFIEQTKSVARLPRWTSPPQLSFSQSDWSGIKAKKVHELCAYLEVIASFSRRYGVQQVLDFGGGVGHLARLMEAKIGLRCFCIEGNEEHITNGQTRQRSFQRPHYFSHYFTHGHDLYPFPDSLQANTLSVGLHTCASLAVAQLVNSVALAAPVVLNMACCYYKTQPADRKISMLFRETVPFEFSTEGLFLATQPHQRVAAIDIAKKLNVKAYRYGIFLFLYEECERTQAFTYLGNSPRELYMGPFALYAREQLRRVGENPNRFSEAHLNAFYQSPRVVREIKQMIACEAMRMLLGRPLEKLFLLDRVAWLQEHGYRSQLVELFDEVISPRNLLLIGER